MNFFGTQDFGGGRPQPSATPQRPDLEGCLLVFPFCRGTLHNPISQRNETWYLSSAPLSHECTSNFPLHQTRSGLSHFPRKDWQFMVLLRGRSSCGEVCPGL